MKRMHGILFGLVGLLAAGAGPAAESTPASADAPETSTKEKTVKAVLKTSQGDIELELDRAKAPATVDNFLQYARDGHYNGTIFHRVIDGFMIQGGGFTPDMKQKPTRAPVKNEASNGLKNTLGTVAMARTPDPHSATSQFFINVSNNAFLDYKNSTPQGYGYCVFGRVTGGTDVVEKLKGVATGRQGMHENVPKEPIEILSVELPE